MAEILEFPELAEHHGVAEVQIGARRICAELYFQRFARLEAVQQLFFELFGTDDFNDIADNNIKLFLYGWKTHEFSCFA